MKPYEPRPAVKCVVVLSVEEVRALRACLGRPEIWGEPDTTPIASVLEKLDEATFADSFERCVYRFRQQMAAREAANCRPAKGP